jgi:heptosyltransferase I
MRVLVIKLSSLGDLFHALPTVARIHEVWGAEIDWVTNKAYVDLVRRFSPVKRVIGFPRQQFISGAGAFLREVRQEQYDYVFDMQGLLKSAITARSARSGKIIGPSFHREGSGLFYSAVAGPKNKNRHAVEENLDLLDHLGIERGPLKFPVTFDRPASIPSGPRIGLLPCSRWKTKNWPPEHFIEVARALSAQARVFIFGAPEDRDVCAHIAGQAGEGVTDMCAKTSLVELGGWLAAMDLVITVDSGPMHMAAAAGTPVLAVFGATDHRRTGPYGARHKVLHRDDLACRPCLSRTCQLKERDMRCLVGLTPDRVITAARELLERKRPA